MDADIKIKSTGKGCATKILLNGVDISGMVQSVAFHQTGGARPTVSFTFAGDKVSINSCAVAKYPDELMDAILTKSVQELEKNLDRVLKASSEPEENR